MYELYKYPKQGEKCNFGKKQMKGVIGLFCISLNQKQIMT